MHPPRSFSRTRFAHTHKKKLNHDVARSHSDSRASKPRPTESNKRRSTPELRRRNNTDRQREINENNENPHTHHFQPIRCATDEHPTSARTRFPALYFFFTENFAPSVTFLRGSARNNNKKREKNNPQAQQHQHSANTTNRSTVDPAAPFEQWKISQRHADVSREAGGGGVLQNRGRLASEAERTQIRSRGGQSENPEVETHAHTHTHRQKQRQVRPSQQRKGFVANELICRKRPSQRTGTVTTSCPRQHERNHLFGNSVLTWGFCV